MVAIHGYASDEMYEEMERLVEEDKYEDKSELVNFAVNYLLYHKHGVEL